MAFTILLSPVSRDHLRALRKRDQQVVLDAIDAQLAHQPHGETSHRKRLEENPVAPWELRIGDFRVFYEFDLEDQRVVILAIGRKIHNRLWIGGEEIEL